MACSTRLVPLDISNLIYLACDLDIITSLTLNNKSTYSVSYGVLPEPDQQLGKEKLVQEQKDAAALARSGTIADTGC